MVTRFLGDLRSDVGENDHATEQLAKRVADMIRLEIASGHFVQHRREHREIFALTRVT